MIRLRRGSTAFARVFVCYRREPTSGHAGRLFDGLERALGAGSVFMDRGLDPGVDFVAAIEEHLDRCDVVIAVVQPGWASMSDAAGRRRLDDPQDFVRRELATAIARSIRVIPILVGGAAMPSPEELPQDLRGLAELPALALRDQVYQERLAELQRTVKETLDAERRRRADAGRLSKVGSNWQWRGSLRGDQEEVYRLLTALMTERFPGEAKNGLLLGKPPDELILLRPAGYTVRDLFVGLSGGAGARRTLVLATAPRSHKGELKKLAGTIVESGRADVRARNTSTGMPAVTRS